MLSPVDARWRQKVLHSCGNAAETLAKFGDREGLEETTQIVAVVEQMDSAEKVRAEKRRVMERLLGVAIRIAAERGLRRRP